MVHLTQKLSEAARSWKVKVVTPIRLKPNISKAAGYKWPSIKMAYGKSR